MVTVMYILANVYKILHMAKVLLCKPPMVNNTLEIGTKINNTALVLRHGKTVLVTMDNIN